MQISRANKKIQIAPVGVKCLAFRADRRLGSEGMSGIVIPPLQGAGTLIGKLCWEQDLNLQKGVMSSSVLANPLKPAYTNDKPYIRYKVAFLHYALSIPPSQHIYFINY